MLFIGFVVVVKAKTKTYVFANTAATFRYIFRHIAAVCLLSFQDIFPSQCAGLYFQKTEKPHALHFREFFFRFRRFAPLPQKSN